MDKELIPICFHRGWGSNPNVLPANHHFDSAPYLFQGLNLPTTSVGGGIGDVDQNLKVRLDNKEMWEQFSEIGNEMIVTRPGRRMFPSVNIRIEGLKPDAVYMILLDVVPADSNRYRFFNSKWSVSGEAEPIMTGHKVIVHSSSPALGSYWMSKSISFKDTKITNNATDKGSNIVLNSMQKYIPRIYIAEASDLIQLRTAHKHIFTFPKTAFIAVTAYQNRKITKLKIDNNPFAKGFRENSKRTTNKPEDDDDDDDKESTASSHSIERQDNNRIENNNSNDNNSINNFGSHFDDNHHGPNHKPFAPPGMVDKTSTPLQNRIPMDLSFDTTFHNSSFDCNQPPTTATPKPLQYRSFDDSGYSSANLTNSSFTSPRQDFQVNPAQYSHMADSNYYSMTSPTISDYSTASPTAGYYNFFAPGDSYGSTPPSFVQRHLDKRRRRQLQQPYQLPSQNHYNP